MPTDEALFIKPTTNPCEIHDWPLEGLPARLVEAMRERHGKGGLNACRECLQRSRDEAYRTLSTDEKMLADRMKDARLKPLASR